MTTRRRTRFQVTFVLLAFSGVSYALVQSLVAPALPDIQESLGTSVNSVSWVLTAFLLSASIATPVLGRLGDIHGKEKLLVISLAIFCVGLGISALAGSLALMLVGRIAQGSAGGIFPLAFGIIRDEFPRPRVAGAIGLMSALMGVGGGTGVVLAGPIVEHLSYHYLFWLPLIVLVPATVAIQRFVPESPVRVAGSVNWVGTALMAVGLGCVLIAVSESPVWHWTSPKTLGLLAVGACLLVAWVRSESRAKEPLVDMRMMRIRGVWTTNSVAFLLGFGMYSAFILIPEFVETPSRYGYGFGSSITGAGLFLLPSTTAMLLLGSQTGRFERMFGSKPPLIAGALLNAVSYTMLATTHGHPWEVFVAATLFGGGTGLAFAAMVNLIIENVGPAETGVATGINTVTRTIGGAFGGAVTASILASTVDAGGRASEHGFTMAFAACAIAPMLGALLALAIPQRRPADAFARHEAGDLPASLVAEQEYTA